MPLEVHMTFPNTTLEIFFSTVDVISSQTSIFYLQYHIKPAWYAYMKYLEMSDIIQTYRKLF